jgi:polyhydroxyalkanoate synthase subunit PhaC
MNPFSFDPTAASQEALRFNQKLAAGLQTLQSLPKDIHYGATAKEAVWQQDKVVLYHFKSKHKKTTKTPLLISYALVNRPYMVDLQADRTIVGSLLEQGHDIYLIDWGYPDPSDKYVTLDDYINGYLGGCVDFLRRQHGVPAINLLGICQGGAFSLCYTAMHPQKIKNLITMVTPVDFHTKDNMLSQWTQQMDVDLFVDTLGNVPADLMNWCYLTLKPFRLFQQKYIGLVDILDNPAELENFVRMEKWIFDSPDQVGEAFRQFIKDFYQGNKLIKGTLEIGGQNIDLKKIRQPVLNIYAEQDHLVPPSASIPLKDAVGTKDYTQLNFKGGHIGIYVSGRAQREVPPAISAWLKKRD